MAAMRAPSNSTHSATALQLCENMRTLASTGDWQKVEEFAIKLRTAVLKVPESERRETILAIRRSTDKVQALAMRERSAIAGKLSALHRGRDATRAYGNAAAGDIQSKLAPVR